MIDYTIWPWIERLPTLAEICGKEIKKDRFPNMLTWRELMLGDKAVKATIMDTSKHVQFYTPYVVGDKPDILSHSLCYSIVYQTL